MKNQNISSLKSTFTIPLAMAIILIPFSLLIGWNMASMVVFWFVVIPLVSHLIPRKVFKSTNPMKESIIGLTIFYTLMTFMIYEHSDFLQLMLISFVVNLLALFFIQLDKKVNREVAG
ncbi:hypothetical protein OB69_05685 [Roseivirga seohaensis subsp. aquiponti]|uniref:Uncharacterized protein n=1 Tax=Roseivirga seohaensis subsp. aquiponti TaxID=1566026 RepID=A0A0L8AM33_9BACT|nr:hypothetical protein [Roseivirga seohaensis]KOF03389.1 hypothetical protein OB69_05685 [Roseivirga seohaensis subsp. aquiponti]